MKYEIQLVDTKEEFERLEPEWNSLLADSPANNYFLTWEWLWNWWQVYRCSEDILSIFVMKTGGVVCGIAPFYIRTVRLGKLLPVRRMMFLGTQPGGDGEACSDYMNIVYSDGEERNMIEMLFRMIDRYDVCDEIFFSKIDTAAKTLELFHNEAMRLGFLAVVPDRYESPYISLPAKWEDYLNSLSPSMRARIRNERRKIERNNNAKLVRVEKNEDIEPAFAELARLNSSRWGKKGAFSFNEFYQFHKIIMPSMLNKGRLKMRVLSIDGCSRAAIYNIAYKNKIYGYQSGTDISDGKRSLGYALQSYCIEEAIKEGLSEYDFLPKGHFDGYKDRFTKEYRTVCDLYIACSRTAKQFIRLRESARSIYHRIKHC